MLYRDDVPHVEVGVLGSDPPPSGGAVAASSLPGGVVATAVHRGDYSGLDGAHRAVRVWCAEHGRELAGPRWEVYGHWRGEAATAETEISYLLR
jgi:effector-binding domain-containing protein